MATKKKGATKTASKKAAKQAAKAPAKKAAPAKAAKAAAKKAAPAAKKAAAKAPAKKAATAKTTKTTVKKAAPAKAAKAATKKAAEKTVAKTATPKSTAQNVASATAAKAEKAKSPETKAASAPAATEQPAIKPVVQQAIKELKKEEKQKKPIELKPIKTSVTTSVKYQPDFTKSILDTTPVEEKPQGPMVRYSDAELQEFKELILRKLEAAKKELAYLQGLITRKDEMGGGESEGRYMTMEDGSVSMEREQLAQMASRQITYIDHLEKALMRIENKTYGICRVTGKLIDKARLRAVPHATLSIEAKMGLVKGPSTSSGE